MTRTQKLRLCSWARTDPVSLSEINENFSLLETGADSALTCAEAALFNTAGQQLLSERQGLPAVSSARIWTAPLNAAADCAAMEHTLFEDNAVTFLPSDTAAAAGEMLGEPGVSYSGGGRHRVPETGWFEMARLTSLTGFCTLSAVSATAVSGSPFGWDGVNERNIDCDLQLFLFEDGTQLAASQHVTLSGETRETVTFSFASVPLDPNREYSFWLSSGEALEEGQESILSCGVTQSVAFTVTAQPSNTGSVTLAAFSLPDDARRLRIAALCEHSVPALQARFDGGAWQPVSMSGASGSIQIPAGAQTAQLRAALNASADCLQGLATAIL